MITIFYNKQKKKKKRRFYKYHAEKSGESNQLTINILRNVLILSSLIPWLLL